MSYPPAFLEQIKAALPVLKVVRQYHKLRSEGANRWRGIDDPSLTVNTELNRWDDWGKGNNGGDIFAFEMHKTGRGFDVAIERLAALAGLPLPNGYRPQSAAKINANAKTNGAAAGPMGPEPPAEPTDYGVAPFYAARREITATYDYCNLDGQMVYQVCRTEWIGDDGRRKKKFSQRRPHGPTVDDKPRAWIWGLSEGAYLRGRDGNFYAATQERAEKWLDAERVEMPACPHLLYRLPQLREEMAQDEAERRIAYIPEGERDVETLVAWGLCAATNSGGADNWRPEHAEEFRGADVVVLEDNDEAGRTRGHKIALSLRGIAKRVRVLRWPQFWPGCPDGGDVTDWRNHGGGTLDKLYEILDALAEWAPEEAEEQPPDADGVTGNDWPPRARERRPDAGARVRPRSDPAGVGEMG